ncbi:chemotaxis protein CheC [Acetivibrio ethanolgignens]|uniref:CheY-P-specific phosphatase CheC n=1 Tax=Acetivibrio ethanolgignens TaxID=290052 RepID=A0A0V8QJP3_9FIRM|nr:chemotaxis protein CheC [Acetivibrio ethanolgignens]KSV60702.1 CheY-P-specific phosphatase CheC [Acetivibrio ethanolgignens]
MSDFEYGELNAMEFDVLKEIGNIGAGNATTALSQLINAKVDMKVPNVELLGFKDLADIIGGPENLIVGILLTLEGEIDGMMMFMLEQDSAHHIVNMIMGRDINSFEEFSEMDLSALNEIGNIIAGAYLSAISTLTNMTITSSVPYMAIDMAGAILSVPAIEFGKVSDKALVIKTQVYENDKAVNGYFVLIPTLESYSKIMASLGL